ncbi:hypothetical protein BG262_08080 [Floricoccus penangensis]|uniref:FAD-dependent oxidoreductase n=1 Tax=Floricoccus penangensis TaxID=1859475 RepID=A0A9Q5P127_9LACT|nr:hypothetical protein [Floricoccus penangensis]OFI47652.1 hypothetical protein BG262_08080 [Floricoccus penangensis]
MNEYDFTIIGAGVSGLFTAIEIIKEKPGVKILIIEKGPSFDNRTESDVYNGFGGLGISEGKYNFSVDFGGDLVDKIGLQNTTYCLSKVEEYLNEFNGKDSLNYQSHYFQAPDESEIRFIDNKVKHLGRKLSKEVIKNIFNYLVENNTQVINSVNILGIEKKNSKFLIKIEGVENSIISRNLIIATGINSDFVTNLSDKFQLTKEKSRVDFGLRMEMPSNQLNQILGDDLEVKMLYKDLYTYCMNKNGNIIPKKMLGFSLADGQNYREGELSDNLNFCLFKPYYFEGEPHLLNYLNNMMEKINKASDELIGQKLSDFDPYFKEKNTISKSMNYRESDLYNYLPEDLLNDTKGFLHELDELLDEDIEGNSILYGIDIKFHSPKIKTDPVFQSSVEGLYFVGDCSGVTYSLSHAAASGIYLGRQMVYDI